MEVRLIRNLLLLVIVGSMSACRLNEPTEPVEFTNTIVVDNSKTAPDSNTITSDSELNKESIKLADNKGVRFEYALGEKTEYGENLMIDIECLVINETNKEVNYLNESCNGLDYFLIIRPDSYQVMSLIHCNVTWAKISKLAPKDSIVFKTQILQFTDSKPIEKIGIDFRATDRFIPFDSLRKNAKLVEKIYRSETQIDNVIWGNKNKMP